MKNIILGIMIFFSSQAFASTENCFADAEMVDFRKGFSHLIVEFIVESDDCEDGNCSGKISYMIHYQADNNAYEIPRELSYLIKSGSQRIDKKTYTAVRWPQEPGEVSGVEVVNVSCNNF